MSEDLKTSFLTYYIRSLAERTRDEKTGTKFGFDWVIYNIGLAADWSPHRLPFLRGAADETSKTKSEAEFGVDIAFLSPDRRTLRIFVLKDEVLNNANWGRHSFDVDLRSACAPDISSPELAEVSEVHVILAYNKDEDRNGVEHFDRLTASMPTRIADDVALSLDRWNLTTIVDKVKASLLSPSLLPQKFFSQFSYICAQFADFRHGSDEWTDQLVPNWRRFLEELLSELADERCVRLLPVALLILQEHGKANQTSETGWIDLMEWGMLSAWNVAKNTEKKEISNAVAQIWISFYVAELDRYYRSHAADLAVGFSVHKRLSDSLVDTVAAAMIAHWHTARLGILGAAYAELLPRNSDEATDAREQALTEVSNWFAGHLIANPAAMRPVLDIHHIELFLAWAVFMQIGRDEDVYRWLLMLINRLSVRRAGLAEIPFIEGSNGIELVFECVAVSKQPPEFCDGSSVYMICLMELLCALPEQQRDELLEKAYLLLALGKDSAGEIMEGVEPLDLMLWIPPADWSDRVLTKTLADEGECAGIHLGSPGEAVPLTGAEVAASIENSVRETREKREFKYLSGLPLSVVVLACLKHRSPLPPELWRRAIFENDDRDTETTTGEAVS